MHKEKDYGIAFIENYHKLDIGYFSLVVRRYYDISDFTSLEDYNARYIGHAYQYSKKELEQILDECGLRIEKYELSDNNYHNILVKHK